MVERAKRVWLSDSLEFGFSFFFKVWVFMYLTKIIYQYFLKQYTLTMSRVYSNR